MFRQITLEAAQDHRCKLQTYRYKPKFQKNRIFTNTNSHATMSHKIPHPKPTPRNPYCLPSKTLQNLAETLNPEAREALIRRTTYELHNEQPLGFPNDGLSLVCPKP